MNTDRFTKFAVPDASVVGFSQSKKQQEFIGDCMEREAAEKMGRMRARPMWCSCNACMLGRFNDCEMKAQMGGALRRVAAPLAAGVQERRPQMQSLEAWRDELKDGMLVAVRAVRADHHMEGVYWLARLMGLAFAAPARLVHATSVFEEGWLIVQAQYYKLEQVSERGYRLLPEKRYLVVNTLIRLTGLVFSRSQGGPQQRELRTTATGPAAAARKEGLGGLSFFSEDMHNMSLSTCAEADEMHNAACEADQYSPDGVLLNPAPDIAYEEEE